MAVSTPPVDTFEHDIANEIRQKEASITDIAAAVGDIGNTNNNENSSRGSGLLIGVVLVLVLCAIVGLIAMGYLYYTGKYNPFSPSVDVTTEAKKATSKSGLTLISVYPTIEKAVGIHVTDIEKAPSGYIVTINSYSSVFSYMVKNEEVIKEELGMSVNSRQNKNQKVEPEKATTTPPTTTPTISTTTGTSTATKPSTQTQSTSTPYATSTEETLVALLPDPDEFSDVTIDNQNMRVGNSLFGPVVYAFVGTQHLVISSSTAGALSLRNSILRK